MGNCTQIFRDIPTTYHENDSDLIILGDSLTLLKKIKSESVDMVFADPPYNIGKNLLLDRLTKDQYIAWSKMWIVECMRILKDTGTFYYMTATQSMPYIDSFIDTNFTVLSRIIWHYDSSGVQAKRYFGSMYEPILMIVKDIKKYEFNSEAVMVDAKTGSKRKLIDYRKTPPQPYNSQKVMGNVWNIPRVRYLMNEYENHPTQKPEKLMEIMIRASSHENDLILDPFAGSFSTAAVAQKLNRRTISIEILEEYYKIGLRRLNLASEYNGEPLVKIRKRKTSNKSKKDHIKTKENFK